LICLSRSLRTSAGWRGVGCDRCCCACKRVLGLSVCGLQRGRRSNRRADGWARLGRVGERPFHLGLGSLTPTHAPLTVHYLFGNNHEQKGWPWLDSNASRILNRGHAIMFVNALPRAHYGPCYLDPFLGPPWALMPPGVNIRFPKASCILASNHQFLEPPDQASEAVSARVTSAS
jgi:hypothetical protein